MAQTHGKPTNKPKTAPQTTSVEYDVPDGGYGWVVVFSAFVYICLPMGISASFGLYFEEWSDYFQAGKVRTSLIGSVGSGCVPLLGSFGGMILTNLFNDIRLVGIVGCFLSSSALVLSSFVNDVSLLTFVYGAMGGFGMGLMFNCAYLSVGYYFDKNRPLATAIASSGTGFGTLISLVIRQVIEKYGWRGSLYILAGVCVQAMVTGMLIRPLYAKKIKKAVMAPIEEVLPDTDRSIRLNGRSSEQEAAPMLEETKMSNGESMDKRKVFSSHDGIFRKHSLLGSTQPGREFTSHMVLRGQHSHHHDAEAALYQHKGDVKINPYNREDVFFSGSTYDLQKIQNERIHTQPAVTQSQMTLDDVPVHQTGCMKIRANIRKNFNMRIFKNPTFFLVVLGMTLHHMAFFIPYTYIISLTKERNVPQENVSYLIICFGLSNFFFKLVIGRLMTLFNVEQLYVVMTTLLLGGLAAIMCTLCSQYWHFVLAAIMYGGTSPIITIYLTNILVRYLGIENLTNAFSIVTMVRGLGSLSGPPLAGYVIEQTGKVTSAFYVGTTADVLSATCFAIIYFMHRGENKDKGVVLADSEDGNNADVKYADDHQDSLSPRVIVTVPTAEGNFDKMIHYSNEKFDKLAAKDQEEHASKMRSRLSHNHHDNKE